VTLCRTPEEAFDAGRQLVRDNGWKLSPAQAARIATLLRPHLQLPPAGESGSKWEESRPEAATGYSSVPTPPAGHHEHMAMSGPQHAKKAEDLLWKAENSKNETERAALFANGQLHATLALLAATVHNGNLTEKQKQWWENHGVRV
jgi:hypothetical protein